MKKVYILFSIALLLISSGVLIAPNMALAWNNNSYSTSYNSSYSNYRDNHVYSGYNMSNQPYQYYGNTGVSMNSRGVSYAFGNHNSYYYSPDYNYGYNNYGYDGYSSYNYGSNYTSFYYPSYYNYSSYGCSVLSSLILGCGSSSYYSPTYYYNGGYDEYYY